MGERQQISRVSDNNSNSPQGEEQEQNTLNLNGICSTSDRCSTRTTSTGDDNYIYFGGTERDNQVSTNDGGNRPYEGGSRVTLQRGDTFWKLAEEKYGHCKHPLEAIYAANGLYPKVNEKDGRIEMTDPTYYAGKTYVLPDERDIDALTKQYRQRVEELGRSSPPRVGTANEESNVKLIYGDTFERMAKAKYGHSVPVEAIYEANGLQQTITEKNGERCTKDPIYYAGKTYKLPAEQDIPDLVRRYYDRIGRPNDCPEQYRGEGRRTDDNYGNYGETDRDRQVQGDTGRRDGNYSDYGDTRRKKDCPPERRNERVSNGDTIYNEGYEDGYRDALERARREGRRDNRHDNRHERRHECACGGAGCSACGGGSRERNRSQCGCGGAGCEACIGSMRQREPYIDQILYYRQAGRDYTEEQYDRTRSRRYNDDQQWNRRMWGCQACGGGGCDACYNTEYGPPRRRRHRQ